MKFTKSLLALSAAGFFFVSCKDAAKPSEEVNAGTETATTSEAPAGKMETASFNIEGMSCSMGCAKTIENKLAKLDGVQKATVDFEKKTATVEFDASKQTPEKLVEVVEAAADGKTYKVSNVKSSGDHAMFIKEKKKNKKKAEKKTEEKKSCAEDKTTTGGKPACCSAKKSCSTEEKKTL